MALGRRIQAASPNLRAFARLEHAERRRLRNSAIDLREFWTRYLLGAERELGFELMTATRAYRSFMATQAKLVAAGHHALIVDVGAGTGDLALSLERLGDSENTKIVAVDFIVDALKRGRGRLAGSGSAPRASHASVACRLGQPAALIPLADASADAVVASLLLSYVEDPALVLAEIRRVLRSRGRLIASTMRRDADISRIYREGVAELPPDRIREHFGPRTQAQIDLYQRGLLNNAATLLRLEEDGVFRFWDEDEFISLLREAGFSVLEVVHAFGEPPQALVVHAQVA
jgi:ubiquinone/menaquinone biosynthesis C-methylase UbiE